MASGAACACNLPADSGDGVQGLALELYGSPEIAVANRALARSSFSFAHAFFCSYLGSKYITTLAIYDHAGVRVVEDKFREVLGRLDNTVKLEWLQLFN